MPEINSNLKKYIIKNDKNDNYHAFNATTHKQIHGALAIDIIFKELNFTNGLDDRIDYKAENNYCQVYMLARHLVLKALYSHNSGCYALDCLLDESHFTVPFHCDYYTPGFTKLYRIHMPLRKICKKFGVSTTSVNNLFKVLRHYGYAIVHYGNITFSPLMKYVGPLKLKGKAMKYYRKLLDNDKYGKRYLSNPALRMKATGLIK